VADTGRDLKFLYAFREQRFHALTHGIRVFIQGTDITPWLKGSVNVTYGNRDSFNTASFELSNPHQIWQITPRNLGIGTGEGGENGPGLFRETAGEYSERAKLEIFKIKNDIKANPFFELEIIGGKLGVKSKSNAGSLLKEGVGETRPSLLFGSKQYIDPEQFQERKWRLALNDCIFNRMDPIRIFMRNPLRQASADEWVEVYCGFVQDHPVSTNFMNGVSSVKINAVCIRNMMTKMRVQLNAYAFTLDPEKIFNDQGSFFNDFSRSGAYTHAFGATSLDDTIRELICGENLNAAREKDERGFDLDRASIKGVGGFKPGNTICYDPENPGDALERWHLLTLFGCNKLGSPTGAGDDLWLTGDEMRKVGAATIALSTNSVSSPWCRYLHFLLPKSGTGAGKLVSYNVDTTYKRREWTTRWEIIRDFASKLDFQVLTSPSGDVLVEFPQYGFQPCMYKKRDNNVCKPGEEGGLEHLLTFNLHQKDEILNDEGEDFPTVLQVTGGMAFQPFNVNAADYLLPVTYIYSPQLVQRYGVIAETHDFPFIGQSAGENAPENLGEGGMLSRMAKLGLIEYTRRMADASTWEGSVVFRPFLFPNRPVEFKRSNRTALIRSVTHSWQVGQSASTSLSVNMLMAKRKDKSGLSYRLLTGAVNTPVDYASIWGNRAGSLETKTKNSGTSTGFDDKAAANNTPKAPTDPGALKLLKERRSKLYNQEHGFNGGELTLNLLYPPFKERVDRMYQKGLEAKLAGLVVSSTYRSFNAQRILKDDKLMGLGNQDLTVADPGKSFHQYGLAVDFGLTNRADYDKLQAINQEVNPTDPPEWLGNDDYVHWQIPRSWITEVEAARVHGNARREGKSETDAIKAVWTDISAKKPRLSSDFSGAGVHKEGKAGTTVFGNGVAGKCIPTMLTRNGV